MKESKEFKIVKELNKNHACVMLSGKFAILSETINPATGLDGIDFSTVGDIKNLYRNRKIEKLVNDKIKMVNIADIWLDHKDRRQFKGIVFDPDRTPKGYYNIWRGFAVEPKKGSNHRPYLSHVLENICRKNAELYVWVKDWMADAVQNPAKRPGTAIVLRGVQGTGKGVFVTQFGKIFGPHFVHINGQHRLTSNFNSHLKMSLLVFVDEGFWAGDRRDAGTLKGMITEETLLIEPKFQDAIPLKNHLRVIMASNSDWVVPADLEERRFCVLDVSDQYQRNTAYFGSIIDEMDNGGREHLLYELLNHKIISNLREIPRTQALYDQILESIDSIKKWWLHCLYEGKICDFDERWPEYRSCLEVQDAYLEFAKGIDRHPVKGAPFFKKLNRLCPGIRKTKMDLGEGRRNTYIFPFLADARQAFESKIEIPIDWDGDDPPF
jgi:phage/plasmid-associated DNA primase